MGISRTHWGHSQLSLYASSSVHAVWVDCKSINTTTNQVADIADEWEARWDYGDSIFQHFSLDMIWIIFLHYIPGSVSLSMLCCCKLSTVQYVRDVWFLWLIYLVITLISKLQRITFFWGGNKMKQFLIVRYGGDLWYTFMNKLHGRPRGNSK